METDLHLPQAPPSAWASVLGGLKKAIQSGNQTTALSFHFGPRGYPPKKNLQGVSTITRSLTYAEKKHDSNLKGLHTMGVRNPTLFLRRSYRYPH